MMLLLLRMCEKTQPVLQRGFMLSVRGQFIPSMRSHVVNQLKLASLAREWDEG